MKKLTQLFFSTASVFVLSACAVGPDYKKPQQQWAASSNAVAPVFSNVVQSSAIHNSAWWLMLDDAQLDQLIGKALQNNQDIRQATARLGAAMASVDESYWQQLPRLSPEAGYSRSRMQQQGADGQLIRPQGEASRIGAAVQWEVDLFGRLRRMQEASLARSEAADADLSQVRMSIVAAVATSWFEYRGLQQQIELAQAEQQSWRETLKLVQSGVTLGRELPENLENVQAQLHRSDAALPALRAAQQAARYRLDVLTGVQPGQQEVYENVSLTPLLLRELLVGDIREHVLARPDVIQAERLLAAGTADTGAAKAALYPSLNLNGFIGFFALRGSSALGSAAEAYEWGSVLQWDGLNPGNARARLRASEARLTGASANYQQAVLLAFEEVENALTALREEQQQLLSLTQAASHAERALTLASKRYEAGTGSYLAVLENQRALFAVRQQVASAETGSYLNVVDLYKSLGWSIDGGTLALN